MVDMENKRSDALLGIHGRTLVIFFVLVGLFGSAWAAFATFGEAPLLTRGSSYSFHVGFAVGVTPIDEKRFHGTLSTQGVSAREPFDQGEFVLQRDPESPAGRCGILVTKKSDSVLRNLKLRVWPTATPGAYSGLLEFNYRGQPIDENMRGVNCYVEQRTFESFCPQKRDGAIYQQQGESSQQPAKVGNATRGG